MANKEIPTAESLLQNEDCVLNDSYRTDFILEKMIEFAKLHHEAQVKAIKQKLEKGLETFGVSLTDDFELETTGNDLINNAYPIENIK